jgi:hypothetical protein
MTGSRLSFRAACSRQAAADQSHTDTGHHCRWFDLLVHGYFAVTIANVFFPSGSETASLVLTLGTFSVSFLVAP